MVVRFPVKTNHPEISPISHEKHFYLTSHVPWLCPVFSLPARCQVEGAILIWEMSFFSQTKEQEAEPIYAPESFPLDVAWLRSAHSPLAKGVPQPSLTLGLGVHTTSRKASLVSYQWAGGGILYQNTNKWEPSHRWSEQVLATIIDL